jgi:hypothetical protein
VALLPATTLCVPGVVASEKSAAGFTTSVAGAVWVKVPLMPVTVTVEVAGGVPPDVVTISTAVPGAVTVEGVTVAVAPAGWPAAVRATAPLNPPCAPIVRG